MLNNIKQDIMKLEIKHISPYLPYNLLSVSFRDRLRLNKRVVANNVMTFLDGSTDSKIVLRPLRDLLNEDLDYLVNQHSTDYFADNNGLEQLINDCLYKNNLHNYIEFLPNGLVDWFIKNHYDIFNLIENGLAIDINTLQQ